MIELSRGGGWLVVVSFVAALLLAVWPLPQWALWARPDWVALVLIYWIVALPERVGLGVAFALGLLLDLAEGAVLGQHALALSAVAFSSLIVYRRLKVFSGWQQMLVVSLLLALNHSLCYLVQSLTSAGPDGGWILLPVLSGTALWPVIVSLLRYLQRTPDGW